MHGVLSLQLGDPSAESVGDRGGWGNEALLDEQGWHRGGTRPDELAQLGSGLWKMVHALVHSRWAPFTASPTGGSYIRYDASVPGEEIRFKAADGYALAGTMFEPPGVARASVLVNPAMAVRREYYAGFAAFLAENGLRTLIYDYRGIGGSRPAKLRGFAATAHGWGEDDATAALEFLAQQDPQAKLLLVGHSIGGQLLGMMRNHAKVDAAYLVAAQSGDWRHWPFPGRLGMIAVWYAVIPAVVPLFGYAPRQIGLGQDVPKGVVLEWASWGRRKRYLLGGDGAAKWGERYRAVRTPILSTSFADDPYAPRPTVEELLTFFENAPREHRHLKPAEIGAKRVGHFGFFRSAFRDTLWKDAAEWLEQRAR